MNINDYYFGTSPGPIRHFSKKTNLTPNLVGLAKPTNYHLFDTIT
jgi:hypothetical protein